MNKKKIFDEAFKNYKKNNFEIAEKLCKQILSIDSNHFPSIFLLGSLSAQTMDFDKAKKLFDKAIQINPNYADAHNNLGSVLKKLGEHQKSITSYEKAIQINPNYAVANYNLGTVFYKLRELQKALNCYQNTIKIEPNHAHAYNYLGLVFKDLDNYQKAVSYFEKAIKINPKFSGAYNNLGTIFKHLGEYQKSITSYEKAIQINPNYVEAHQHLGIVLLLLSEFERGFNEYEWRKKQLSKKDYDIKKIGIKTPEWRGEDLTNKTILVIGEQGIGDVIQFARYIYMLQDKYSTAIIFRTRKKLVYLFLKNKFKVISDKDTIPNHNFHKFLLSLPQILYKETKTIPKQINYIPEDKKIILKWKDKLATIKGIKVGINWQGSQNYSGDRLRSIPLNFFHKLFSIENINFINLQKGLGIEQIKHFKYKNKLYDFSSEVDNGENAFQDTIGILQNIDLVITIDTTLPHLSAILGVKTWILLPFSPDWRWFLKIKNSPWYDENVKIYRQEKINKWESVIDKVRKDLINKFN